MAMRTVATTLGPIGYDDRGDVGQPLAVLWPSLFSDHTMWVHQVEALGARGWRSIAIDPPTHGASRGPDRVFSMEECVDAAIQLIEAAAGGRPVVFLGTSWGGMLGPRIAHRRPDLIAGLILFNTTAERPDLQTLLTAKLLLILLSIPPIDGFVNNLLLTLQVGEPTRRAGPEIISELAKRFRSWNRKGLIQSVDSVLVRRDAFLDRLGQVDTPALVVSGSLDTLLPTALNKRIADAMPHGRHVEVEGAAHLVPLERPEQANTLIFGFIDGLSAEDRA